MPRSEAAPAANTPIVGCVERAEREAIVTGSAHGICLGDKPEIEHAFAELPAKSGAPILYYEGAR